MNKFLSRSAFIQMVVGILFHLKLKSFYLNNEICKMPNSETNVKMWTFAEFILTKEGRS